MNQPELVQVNFFSPVLNDLKQKGVNTERLLHHADLDKFNLTDTNNYVPVQRMHSFFDAINKFEGINEDFFTVFKDAIRVKYLDDYGAFTQSAPDLLSAAYLCIRYSYLNYTSEVDGLDIQGKVSKFWINLTEKATPGYEMAAMFHLGLIIDHIRLACGADWSPLEIHLPLEYEPDLSGILEANTDTKLVLGTEEVACVFPTEVLARKVGTSQDFVSNFPLQDLTTRSKIEQLLNSLASGYAPTAENMAEYLGFSFRTLQRRLTDEHTSYSEIFDQWRFKKAIEGLVQEKLSIREVSQNLGFQKIQSFHRSFKRWTGTTPQAYREQVN